LYVRQGITPKYDLVQIEGAVHEPTFKYRVTVGDAVATGTFYIMKYFGIIGFSSCLV